MTKLILTKDDTMKILDDKKVVAEIMKSESERKAGKVITERKLLKELRNFSQRP